jgi:hypothetical protein
VAFWRFREELGREDRLRRSYYELLRDELDQLMIQYGLMDSFLNFKAGKIPYPYVEKRELKPRARIPDMEYECQNVFLVIFLEDTIPAEHKKYIRFFDENKTTKSNLLKSETLPLTDGHDRSQKYLDSVHFKDFLKGLLPVDYALLIQRDPSHQSQNRYGLTHFHVRIDWPISEAAEDLARHLRYVSKDLYEKGEKYAEDIQKKFFEYYSLPAMVGGRRTAAVVAAQYLKRIPCISTIYAASCESRALIRISERGASRIVIFKLTEEEMTDVAEENKISLNQLKKNYMIHKEKNDGVFLFQAIYAPTAQSTPPEDGKIRELKPDLSWVRVDSQQIIPKPGITHSGPLPVNFIYS